jgi:hypothetical protein
MTSIYSWVGNGRFTVAQKEQQALLNALKLELQFCESGGYTTVVEKPKEHTNRKRAPSTSPRAESTGEFRKERSIFLDSPWCLNYRLPIREHACSECWLIKFVPAGKQGEAIPCHHIPLNERGETLAALGGPGDAPHIQQAVRAWLRAKIQELEAARET